MASMAVASMAMAQGSGAGVRQGRCSGRVGKRVLGALGRTSRGWPVVTVSAIFGQVKADRRAVRGSRPRPVVMFSGDVRRDVPR